METQVHDNLNPNLYSIPSRHCRLFSFPHSPGFCSLRRDMTVSLPLFVRVLSPPMTAPVMTTTTTLLPFFLPYFETSFFFFLPPHTYLSSPQTYIRVLESLFSSLFPPIPFHLFLSICYCLTFNNNSPPCLSFYCV